MQKAKEPLVPKTKKGQQILGIFLLIIFIVSVSYAYSVATRTTNSATTFVDKYQKIDQAKYRASH